MIKDPHRVYCKTDKGRQEIVERLHTLTFRQRSTLILMDCAKNLGLIANAIPLAELEKTVPFLLAHGFIVLAEAQHNKARLAVPRGTPDLANVANAPLPPAAVLAPASIQPVLTQNLEVIDKVKNFMLTSSNTHLGLMGTEIIARIQRCHSADQLMAAAAFWHMAFRESKTGKQFATIFLDQVKFELRNGN